MPPSPEAKNAPAAPKGSGNRLRVLYVCKDSYHHYKEVDFAILSERYDVTRFHYKYTPQSVGRLIGLVAEHDFVFAWFASPMAAAAVAAARAAGKKSIIVAGGYDVADYAPLKHGMAHRPVQKHFARFALQQADLVLPVSAFNKGELLRFAKPRHYKLVYNAVDLPEVDIEKPRKKQVVTVGAVEKTYSRLKGHERFIAAAHLLPDVKFIVVGPARDATIDTLTRAAPRNVEFRGFVPHAELVSVLAESSVYAQLSHYESFGVAVAEAMWCGATPVVSDLPALVEVVGDTGYVVRGDDPRESARAIQAAIDGPLPNRAASERAATFSREARRESLLAAVESIVGR